MKALLSIATLAALAVCLLSWTAGEGGGSAEAETTAVNWDAVLRREGPGGAQAQSVPSGTYGRDGEYVRGPDSVASDVLAVPGDGTVRVEIVHELSSDGIRDVVAGLGGEVYGEVPGELVEARVPADALAALEATPGVTSVRAPIQQSIPLSSGPIVDDLGELEDSVALVGEEIAKTNADEWHAEGITGQGVKVGIIDFFDGDLWDGAQENGDLPEPAGEFCLVLGEPCDIWDAGAAHGVAVGEIIHEMAPDAELYVATVYTTSDTQAAVEYFASQGVQIISRSLTSEYDGPGDGTGPLASVIDSAVADGMLWLNAAGNNSGVDGESDGSHWRGTYQNPDGDDWMNWSSHPDDETIAFLCSFLNGLRWSDWGPSGRTDYDLVIWDTPVSPQPKAAGIEEQGNGAPPLEHVNDSLPCFGPLDIDYISVAVFDAGSGTSGDVLEIMGNQTIFSNWNNPNSASGPASDSANPGALSVGAVDPANGTTIAPYSSQGPSTDGRTKPDLSAASCVQSYAYEPDCFNGTSAATPVVAGAAALVLSSGAADSPESVAAYLKAAVVDRGAGGADNVYGTGELLLPEPPEDATATPSPTPELSPPPGPTNTPAPTGTAEPTGTATPAPTVGEGQSVAWTDVDCDGEMSSRDNQSLMRVALQQNRLSQTEPCPDIGSTVTVVGFGELTWGDADCDGSISTRDNQSVMRVVLQQNRLSQTEPCPDVGATVEVSE